MAISKNQAVVDGQEPIAALPVQSVLNKLTQSDRDLLARTLTERVGYMAHESFSRPKTAERLFPEVFATGSTRPWCNAASAQHAEIDQVGSTAPTLSTAEEQALFQQLNYARYRITNILEKFQGKRLTAAATREILWWAPLAEKARCDIVRANMPLVLAMAKRTRLGNIDYAELISEGNMALLRSVDKFDCGRGFKFSTYACRAILKSFSRVAMKIGRYRGRFPVEFDPSLEKSDYLDRKRTNHEADCVDEIVGMIKNNTASLNEVEVKVLQARFALEQIQGQAEGGPRTLEQVGMIIGVTKERVRQIQNRALSKLREKLQDDFLAA